MMTPQDAATFIANVTARNPRAIRIVEQGATWAITMHGDDPRGRVYQMDAPAAEESYDAFARRFWTTNDGWQRLGQPVAPIQGGSEPVQDDRPNGPTIAHKLGLPAAAIESLFSRFEVGGYCGLQVADELRQRYDIDRDECIGAALAARDVLTDDEAEWLDEG